MHARWQQQQEAGDHAAGQATTQGASEAVVRALPLRTVSSSEHVQACPVCLEDMEAGSEVRTLPCNHFFHAACVEGWLKQKNSCPMCREELPAADEFLEQLVLKIFAGPTRSDALHPADSQTAEASM